MCRLVLLLMRLLSMGFDGSYTITTPKSMGDADMYAKTHVNQLHFLIHRNLKQVVQWVGDWLDCISWSDPINPEQAKTALMLFMLEE